MKYKIIFTERKKVALSIRGSTLTVRAPIGLTALRIDMIVTGHMDWIQTNLGRPKKQIVCTSDEDMEIKRLKRCARRYFKERIDYYSALMGLQYSNMKITSAKKQFGSCNSKGNICFSYRLMLYPERAREYIIVHELAHLVHMNHSRDFYDVIEKYMPDYKLRKKLLRTPVKASFEN